MDDNEYELEISSDELCRSCLNQEKNLKSLFCSEILDGQIVSFPKIYQDVTGVKLSKNDSLPSRICVNCKLKVNEFYLFKGKCSRSNELALSLFAKNSNQEVWTVEIDESSTKEDAGLSNRLNTLEPIDKQETLNSSEVIPSQLLVEGELIQTVKNESCESLESPDKPDDDDAASVIDISNIKSEPNSAVSDHAIEEEDDEHTAVEYLEEPDEGPELINDDSSAADDLGELSCEICKIEFESRTEFIDHIKNHDLTEGTPVESIIAYDINKRPKQRRYSRFGDYCRLCKSFVKHKSKDADFFKKHIDLHRQTLRIILETIDLYKCGNCDLVFIEKSVYKDHINAIDYFNCKDMTAENYMEPKCNELEFLDNDFESSNPIKMVNCIKNNETGLLECKSCGDGNYQTAIIDDLIEHSEKDHGDVQIEKQNNGINICNICGNGSHSEVEILMHLYFHLGSFNCPFLNCATSYNSYAKLNTHLERIHLFLSTPTCNHCDENFESYDDLTIHLKKYCEKRIFKCDVCGKTFLSNSSLGVHKRIHNQNTLFVCQFCGKKFTQSGDLRIHVRLHTGERPYPCTLCPKKFRTSGNLQDHMESHNDSKDYLCEICLKSFKGERVLKAHKLIHTGEKKFVCPVCGKQFYRKQHVKSHLRVHERRPTKQNVMDWLDDDVSQSSAGPGVKYVISELK